MPSSIVNRLTTSADKSQSAVLSRIDARKARIAAATAKIGEPTPKRRQSKGPGHQTAPKATPCFAAAQPAARQAEQEPAATQVEQPAVTQEIRDRSPEPVKQLTSILKPSTRIPRHEQICACATRIPDPSGLRAVRAPSWVYAAPHRSLHPKEWVREQLPIEWSAQSEAREPRLSEVQFLPQISVAIVSRWIRR